MVIFVDNELLLIVFRTILILIILFILTKLMGKKQVGQMNIFDYLIGITIGSIAADVSLDIEKNLVAGILSLVIYGISSIIVTYLSLRSIDLRKLFIGSPTILINKGKIIKKNMCKEGIDINDLQEEARQAGYFDLSRINYAILETSGNISFLAKANYEVVTRSDMKLKVNDDGLCINLVVDGILLNDNLKSINKDERWLNNILKNRGYDDYKDIFLLMVDGNLNVIIYDKEDVIKE